MEILDALVYTGSDLLLESYCSADVTSLGRALDRYGVSQALVTAFACRGLNVDRGNALTFEAASQDARLIPCPAVLPNSGLEVGDESTFVADLVSRGARAVCFYPQRFGTGLDSAVVGPLFRALEEHRLPVALFETDVSAAAGLARGYPGLPVIVHAPGYRHRRLIPALRHAANLHVSIAPNFAPYRGLEVLCDEIGPERILFASGFPLHEPGAPITQLLYSGLSDDVIAKIAGGNTKRLLGAVRGVGETQVSQSPGSVPGRDTSLQRVIDRVQHRDGLDWPGVVDMHAHYGAWAEFPIWGGDADDMVAEMDRMGVEQMLVSHQACLSTEAAWGNDQVLEAMRRYPERIMGYATCYPIDQGSALREIRRCIDAGMRGIKLHSSNGVAYTDDRYTSVWEYADERCLPVLLHTWRDMAGYSSLFECYRRAPILLGHAGCANPGPYVDYARRFPNLYLELCFSRAPYGVVEHLVNEVGADRVVWGSDAPWMSPQQQLGRVLFADIPEEDKRTILVENPKRILRRT